MHSERIQHAFLLTILESRLRHWRNVENLSPGDNLLDQTLDDGELKKPKLLVSSIYCNLIT